MNNTNAMVKNVKNDTDSFWYRNSHPDCIVEEEYAFSAVNAVTIATGSSWEQVYRRLFHQAHELCLMPDDVQCIEALLKEYGFFSQSGLALVPIYNLYDVKHYMEEYCHDGQIAIVKTPKYNYGGHMSVVMPESDSEGGEVRYVIADTEDRREWNIEKIWIRWKDGLDHSPFPCRKRKNNNKKTTELSLPPDHPGFHFHQANPAGNYIGDCVVRGIAEVCDISWHEAMDRLGKYGYTTINKPKVYLKLLLEENFFQKSKVLRNNKMLSGVEFCEEMGKKYHNGERIFAYVGRNHVAAVLPVMEEDGTTHYKIIDTWDSSERKIGEYWIQYPQRKKKTVKKVEVPYQTGSRLEHPKFGTGTVLSITDKGTDSILEVSFPDTGVKKVSFGWILKNYSLFFPTEPAQ